MRRTTLTLHDDVMEKLIRVRGQMESKNGKRKCLEDVVRYLIDFFESHREVEK